MKEFEKLRYDCPAFTTGMHNAPKCGAKAYQDHHTTWLQPCYEKHLCPILYWINNIKSEEEDTIYDLRPFFYGLLTTAVIVAIIIGVMMVRS